MCAWQQTQDPHTPPIHAIRFRRSRFLLAFDSVTQVKTFPRHNYGDMTSRTKRMVQVFAASKRLLLCDWNQGFRNCGDSAFVL